MTDKTFSEACKLRDQKKAKSDRIFGILEGIGKPVGADYGFWSRHSELASRLRAEKAKLDADIATLNQAIYDHMRDNDSRIFVGF